VRRLIGVAALLAAGTVRGDALSPKEIAARAIPSVVTIQAGTTLGAGFAVGEGGRIVTNLHVLVGAREAKVVLSDGREFKSVEVMGVDEELDLALLCVPAALKPLPIGETSKVQVGQHVVAIGHPLGLQNTVSDGLVSAVREIAPGRTILQLTAPISPGSSGGPLLDENGSVIGVSTLVVMKGQNLSFAVPAEAVRPLLKVEKGTPLASWPWKTRTPITRAVPHHDVSILDGCSPEGRAQIVERIETAISVGAPAYNEGNHEGCFRTYEATAITIDHKVAGCTGLRGALLAGVKKAATLDSVDGKAWAMRDAFDGVLEVVERGALVARSPSDSSSLPRPPDRHAPNHPLSLLNGCSAESQKKIGRAVSEAIDLGAPLYNAGNFEACFRIYEGTALQVQRMVKSCSGPRKALIVGVKTAASRESWADKAWAMRDAFDGILDLLDRNWGAR
jgi:hypothetical protein